MNFILGTAQFGLHKYGINTKKILELDEIEKILTKAHSFGINYLDTANAYNSEQRLGEIGVEVFKIISKLTLNAEISYQELEDLVSLSLSRLKKEKLYCLHIHNFDDFKNQPADSLFFSLNKLKKYGLIDRIGVSTYNLENINQASGDIDYDVIQCPLNILDQRMLYSSNYKKFMETKEIHVRSIFLQGLLLQEAKFRSNYFKQFKSLQFFDNYAADNGLSNLDLCISFIQDSEINNVVFGVNSVHHLTEIIHSFSLQNSNRIDYKAFLELDERLINPTLW